MGGLEDGRIVGPAERGVSAYFGTGAKKNLLLFFCLDTKEAKNQDCKKLSKNFACFTTENELVIPLFQ